MPSTDQEDSQTYLVVVNAEEQYSIWPLEKRVPAGWSAVGKQGLKSDCLQYIDEVWTDMRPLSLRQRMEADVHLSSDNG
jgi:MbtH protein